MLQVIHYIVQLKGHTLQIPRASVDREFELPNGRGHIQSAGPRQDLVLCPCLGAQTVGSATWMKSKNRWFKLSNDTLKSFSASWPTENVIFSSRYPDDSNGRMALKSHFLPLEKPQNRLWWGRESDVSSGRMTFLTHFRPLDHPKMRIGWDRKRDVSRTRIAFSTYFRPLD